MGPFKKYATCIKAFLIPFTYITLCQFYSIASPVLFSKNNSLWNERKDFFVCMAASAYYHISKVVENCIMDTIFRHMYV